MHSRQPVSSLMVQPYSGWFTGQHKEQSNTSLAIVESYAMGNMKDADVYLISDRYEEYNIKEITRTARRKESSIHHQLSQSMHLPPQKVVLSLWHSTKYSSSMSSWKLCLHITNNYHQPIINSWSQGEIQSQLR